MQSDLRPRQSRSSPCAQDQSGAQWPSFPTPNVPRTADGKPNLLAPAPRTANGKPDLSGIWGSPGWRAMGAGTVEVTVDDSKAYTRPWTVTINNEIMLDTELIEFICLENEKSTQHFR